MLFVMSSIESSLFSSRVKTTRREQRRTNQPSVTRYFAADCDHSHRASVKQVRKSGWLDRSYDSSVGRWTAKNTNGFNGGDTNLSQVIGNNIPGRLGWLGAGLAQRRCLHHTGQFEQHPGGAVYRRYTGD
jgi:hypothetical protein